VDDVAAIPPRHAPERGRTTTRLPPPRERSVYPDDELARYTARPRRGRVEAERLGGLRGGETQMGRWQRAQPWLLPLLIIVSIFLIGAAVSISFQQMRAARSLPTAVATAFTPAITTVAPLPSADAGATVNSAAPPPAAASPVSATVIPTASATAGPGALAIGQGARVIATIPGLNLRERPGTDPTIPILLSLQPGTDVLVVDGPTPADGLDWWKVRVANIEGWCAGEYLAPR
jgi:hypothetical protein